MLTCAVCLYQDLEVPEPAFTIVNGQAVCTEHFQIIAQNQTNNAGQLSLRTVGHPYFDASLPIRVRL